MLHVNWSVRRQHLRDHSAKGCGEASKVSASLPLRLCHQPFRSLGSLWLALVLLVEADMFPARCRGLLCLLFFSIFLLGTDGTRQDQQIASTSSFPSPSPSPHSQAASSSLTSSTKSATLSSYEPFGRIKFVSSCGGPDQRRRLNDGIALVHSFWYEEVHLTPAHPLLMCTSSRNLTISISISKAREIFQALATEVRTIQAMQAVPR